HHTRLRAGTLSHGGMSLRRVFLVIALALGVVPLAPPPAFAMPAPAARFLAARITGAGRSIVTGAIRTTVGFDVAGLRYDGPPAAALTDEPAIVTRAQWGADLRIRRSDPDYGAVHLAIVHHTDTGNDYTPLQARAVVRGIYVFHVKSNGWNDIGYNFLVDRFGTVYEGRYGGMDLPVIGAHTLGFNSVSTGVSLMGTFSAASPSPAMLSSLEQVLAWRLHAAHLHPLGPPTVTSP